MLTPSEPRRHVWRVSFTVPVARVPAFEQMLEPLGDGVCSFEIEEGGDWLVEMFSAGRIDQGDFDTHMRLMTASLGMAMPAVEIEELEDRDWTAQVLQSFKPIEAGRFVVHGSHLAANEVVPPGHMGITVDAGQAFGSGEHGTTLGCLLALDTLSKRRHFRRTLDLGTGSGVLAIAAAKLWPEVVIAADNDPRSVAVARENAARNRVADHVRVMASHGFDNPELARRGPYDLILANILARPLAHLAPDMKRHLTPGGMVVLSGLTVKQDAWVRNAYRRQGIALVRRLVIDGWTTLVLRLGARR